MKGGWQGNDNAHVNNLPADDNDPDMPDGATGNIVDDAEVPDIDMVDAGNGKEESSGSDNNDEDSGDDEDEEEDRSNGGEEWDNGEGSIIVSFSLPELWTLMSNYNSAIRGAQAHIVQYFYMMYLWLQYGEDYRFIPHTLTRGRSFGQHDLSPQMREAEKLQEASQVPLSPTDPKSKIEEPGEYVFLECSFAKFGSYGGIPGGTGSTHQLFLEILSLVRLVYGISSHHCGKWIILLEMLMQPKMAPGAQDTTGSRHEGVRCCPA
ncbi:hypothetical protein B0H19DRAFT_1068930 [Mycena capillaripes]|nr:hypothetical protein B0H19DRAFT_1068930 [Mycena capillaripes]